MTCQCHHWPLLRPPRPPSAFHYLTPPQPHTHHDYGIPQSLMAPKTLDPHGLHGPFWLFHHRNSNLLSFKQLKIPSSLSTTLQSEEEEEKRRMWATYLDKTTCHTVDGVTKTCMRKWIWNQVGKGLVQAYTMKQVI